MTTLRMAYKGTKRYPTITPEERNLAENLELVGRENALSELLGISKILKANGVNLRNIQVTKKQKQKSVAIKLSGIEQEEVDIGAIIEKYGLDPDFPFGDRVIGLRLAYKGKGSFRLTPEDRELAEELEMVEPNTEENRRKAIEELLQIAQTLKSNGVDLKKVPLTRKQNGNKKTIELSEIQQKGIDIKAIIEENRIRWRFSIWN